jgi:hypothetical protein
MFKQAFTIFAFNILFFLFLTNPTTSTSSVCLLQTAVTPPNFIPTISNNICAEPRGTVATDGCDDVCVLTECCKEWKPRSNTLELPNGITIDCSTVNCGDVCRLVCGRQDTPEPCAAEHNCINLSTDGEAYVFSRNGDCKPFDIDILGFHILIPSAVPSSPTHVGFGLEVAQDVYVFGFVENGAGCAAVPPGKDNGFWMTTGSKDQMLATFSDPSASRFYGAIFPIDVINHNQYNQYKTSKVETPNVCAAVKAAEALYLNGYDVASNNCLDAVYNVLKAYGVTFCASVTPQKLWCPSGTSRFSFAKSTGGSTPPTNNWSDAKDIPARGSPVVASDSCPSSVPFSCSVPSSTGSRQGRVIPLPHMRQRATSVFSTSASPIFSASASSIASTTNTTSTASTIPTVPTPSCSPGAQFQNCTTSGDTCDFYTCLESEYHCEGTKYTYPLDYGLKYCTKYTQNLNIFSSAGKQWVHDVRLCLQNALLPETDCESTCKKIQDDAFNSHPACYANNGVCTLYGDWYHIIQIVGLDGLLDGGSQVADTIEMCIAQYEGFGKSGLLQAALAIVGFLAQAGKDVRNAILRMFAGQLRARLLRLVLSVGVPVAGL